VRKALGPWERRPVTGRRWRPFMTGRRNASEYATMRRPRKVRKMLCVIAANWAERRTEGGYDFNFDFNLSSEASYRWFFFIFAN
jgi:hypothetical protein